MCIENSTHLVDICNANFISLHEGSDIIVERILWFMILLFTWLVQTRWINSSQS